MQLLPFTENERTCTLGVEMEIQLLHRDTLTLVPKAADIISQLNHPRLAKEMFQSTLEFVTDVCNSVQEVHRDLSETLSRVKEIAEQQELVFAGTGTNPLANYDDRILSAGSRYHMLLERNQWLIRRMAVYGLHVHIGMRNGDSCILNNNFFLHFLPHLIALSASSPFWVGKDTGLDASRPTMYQAHPTSGLPIRVENWEAFNQLFQSLRATHSIESMKDIWWDLRPSPGYGTLEIRICDGPATMDELLAVVAFIHLMALWFEDHQTEFFEFRKLRPAEWILRENKWRAIRYGLDAKIIRHSSLDEESLRDNFAAWLDRLAPYVTRMQYEPYVATIREILEKGNSASRQRQVFKKSGKLMDTVAHNVREFEAGHPVWDVS